MEGIKPPNSLKLQGNLDFQWKSFKQRFLLYVDATQDWTEATPNNKKMALFLHVAGDEAIELYNTMVFDTIEVRSYDNVVKRFEEYCCPKKNETYERYVFRNRIQAEGEPFEQFALDLKTKAQTCCFGTLSESMIRDQIVYGVNDKKVRERLLRVSDLTREQAEGMCKAAEISKEQTRIFENTKDNSVGYFKDNISSIDAIQSHDKEYRGHRGRGQKLSAQTSEPSENVTRIKVCGNCNRTHGYRECPAYKKICNKCGKFNHFSVVCRAKLKTPVKVHGVEDISESDNYYIDSIKNRRGSRVVEDWWIDVLLNGERVKFKIDTGAQSNTLPNKIYEAWNNKPIKNTRTALLEAYGGSCVESFGSFNTSLEVLGQKEQVQMVLVHDDQQPLLGLKACEQFGLVRKMYVLSPEQEKVKVVTKNYILQKCPELFAGLGCVRQKHTIRLKEGYSPAVYAARRVAHALKGKLRTELNRMLKGGIIRKIEEPTEWVNPIVLVRKGNGDIRICLDPKQLNSSICREYFQIPTREEIEAELAGAAYFSKLDASQGFYQIPLDEKSQELCTFNTPFGRFCFKRLPFGIASAPEVFHKTINQIYEGMDGITTYIDDVLVWGATREEHDKRLLAALEKTRQSGLTLNQDKCVFGVQEITFLGEVLTKDGMKPNPVKVEAVRKMPTPQIKEDVHRALGLITYLGKYIPNLADKTRSLRGLLKKDAHMEWGPEHQEEWNNLKESLCKSPVLQYYDAKLPIKIATDASKGGLGAVLMQHMDNTWLPVAYASRTMTETEGRYAQIEKEALGLIFGCERFHEYIYGRNFVLETDHKPLTAIIKKEIATISPRLQRMFIRLLKYTFELRYIPGKTLIVADALSRAPIKQIQSSKIEEDIKIHTIHVINNLAVSSQKLELIREETKTDVELQEVIQQIQGDWSSRIGGERYRNHKDDLTYVEGIVLRGNRIVMPKSIRKLMLRKLHEGHLGQNKCRARARQVMFWPGMGLEIDNMSQQCPTCRKYQYKMQKEPMIIRPDPGIPWYRVGSDLFMFGGKDYLLTIDAHSNYPEVDKLEDTRAATVIAKLRGVFARHGIPQEVLTDNGPQYTSREFKDFSKEFEFQHITSSPYYPCSNGLAEKGVQIAKRIMRKAHDAGEDWSTGLMNYRSSPLENGKSPAELLMGRNINTKLPEWHRKDSLATSKIKKHRQDDTKGKEIRQLEAGEIVRIWNGDCWNKKAEVLGQVAPRSYQIQTEERTMRRNRSHLLPTRETLEQEEAETDLEQPVATKPNQTGSPLPNDSQYTQQQKLEVSTLPESAQQKELPPAARHDPEPPQIKEAVRRSSRVRKPKIMTNL